MTTPIEIPVSMPGAQQADAQTEKLSASVVKLEKNVRSLYQTHDVHGRALRASTTEVDASAKAHTVAAEKVEKHGASHHELIKELKKGGPAVKELAETFLSEYGAIGLAVGAVSESAKMFYEEFTRDSEMATEAVKKFGEAFEEAQETIAKAREAQGKEAAGGLAKNGETIAGLVASGGSDAVQRAQQLSRETGMDLDQVNKAVLAGLQGGQSIDDVSAGVRGAALLAGQGRGKFDENVKNSRGLPSSMLGGDAAETASNMLNHDAIEKFNSPERRAQEKRDFEYSEIARQNLAEKEWNKKRDYNQSLGIEAPRYDAPRALPFQPGRFKAAGGTSADELRDAQRRIDESPEGKAIREAARQRAIQQGMGQGASLEKGADGETAETHLRMMDESRPGMREAMGQIKAANKKVAAAQRDVDEARANPRFAEDTLIPGLGSWLNKSNLGREAAPQRELESSTNAARAIADAVMKALDADKIKNAVRDGVREGSRGNESAVHP